MIKEHMKLVEEQGIFKKGLNFDWFLSCIQGIPMSKQYFTSSFDLLYDL
jgi:hypothetical protein